jgi:predicted nucleic acid-binding protein
MKFDKNELKNILEMLRSDDKENAYIAFEVIKQSDVNDIPALLTLWKFGNHGKSEWLQYANSHYISLMKAVKDTILLDDLLPGECIFYMSGKNTDTEIIELFIEYYVKNVIAFTKQLNYKLEIKLTKNE